MTLRIKTVYECPPIPHRGADWVAYDDTTYDLGALTGRGATEIEAIRDLLDQMEARDG